MVSQHSETLTMRNLLGVPARAWWVAVLAMLIVPLTLGQAVGQETVNKAREKQAAWENAANRLEQFDRASQDAIEEQIKTLDPVFAEAKGGAKAFADEMLGGWGKLKYVVGATDTVLSTVFDGICDLFGTPQSKCGIPSTTVHLEKYSRDVFDERVITEGKISREASRVASGYLSTLQELENRAVIDLGVDLADGALGPLPPLPDMRPELSRFCTTWSMTNDLVDNAGSDLMVTAVRWAASGLIADKLTEDQPSGVKKTGTNFLIGAQIDGAIDAGLQAAGYDPAGRLAARVGTRLDAVRSGLIYGSKEGGKADEAYISLTRFRLADADADARYACARAADLMEKCRLPLGLRTRLLAIHHQRSIVLRNAIYRSIFGADVPVPASIHLGNPGPRDQTIAWAESWIKFCQARMPKNRTTSR
jgi:hypothetical protein